jgi:hypothetical protein
VFCAHLDPSPACAPASADRPALPLKKGEGGVVSEVKNTDGRFESLVANLKYSDVETCWCKESGTCVAEPGVCMAAFRLIDIFHERVYEKGLA